MSLSTSALTLPSFGTVFLVNVHAIQATKTSSNSKLLLVEVRQFFCSFFCHLAKALVLQLTLGNQAAQMPDTIVSCVGRHLKAVHECSGRASTCKDLQGHKNLHLGVHDWFPVQQSAMCEEWRSISGNFHDCLNNGTSDSKNALKLFLK